MIKHGMFAINYEGRDVMYYNSIDDDRSAYTNFKTDKQSEKYYRLVVNMLDRVYIRCIVLEHSTYWEFK
jgi:hypothetical protein